ncbi:MAG: transglycosylase domain-containing protein [Spirochaetaceae bacterium]|jgi:penicillin-binding protein 1C|nr:transglycosylase domain-containing protein [Spirochaetaceae bacterium]
MFRRRFAVAPVVVAAVVVLCLFLVLRFSPYPALDAFLERDNSVRFYDRNGVLLQVTAVENGARREYAAFDEFPAMLRDIAVFSEDRRFYVHWGVDIAAVARAFAQNVRSERTVSGASTVTMQLARIIGGTGNRSVAGKLAEAVNAARLEARFSKKQILEMYLNAVPFGGGNEGFASAARAFFSKDLADLSPAQMCVLAVMPRRPALYNPLEHPVESAAAARSLHERTGKNRRLAKRYPELAALTGEGFDFAVNGARRFVYPFEAPHFVRYMAGGLRERGERVSEARLTIDIDVQRLAEGYISGGVARYASSRLTNGAVLAIDNQTGEILAWVGSADFFNEEHAGQIDGVLALNQPGSSMKPFLYALALERGFLPTDVFADIPKNYGDTELYIPQNFNNRFNGPVLFRTALASSLNIPAVDLLYRLGVKNYAERLFSLGFDSVRDAVDDAGLGLALGNAPVSLLELVRAFSVFPNEGIINPLRGFTSGVSLEFRYGALRGVPAEGVAEDTRSGAGARGRLPPFGLSDDSSDGNGESGRVYDADTARIISSMLSDRSARVLAFGPVTNFETGFPSMFKTGTANQYQSIVALGATPLYTVGVWMGNFTGETVIGRTGSSVPAAVARDVLMFLQGNTSVAFRRPEHWARRSVCALSGMRAGPLCVAVADEWEYAGSGVADAAVGPVCDWHNADGTVTYPAEYQAWFLAAGRRGGLDYNSAPLEVLSPREGFVFFDGPGTGLSEVPVEVTGGAADELAVDYDGAVWSVEGRPFVFFLPLERGAHRLALRCGGEEATVRFRVE